MLPGRSLEKHCGLQMKKLLLLRRSLQATLGYRGDGWENGGKVWVLACEYPHGRVAISMVFPRGDPGTLQSRAVGF